MKVTGPGQSPLLLLDIIPVINKLDISYAVIGAFAGSFYGSVRASLDADILISIKTEDIDKLLTELKNKELKATYNKGDLSDPIEGLVN